MKTSTQPVRSTRPFPAESPSNEPLGRVHSVAETAKALGGMVESAKQLLQRAETINGRLQGWPNSVTVTATDNPSPPQCLLEDITSQSFVLANTLTDLGYQLTRIEECLG